jgi:hypothetical protein
MTLHDKTLNIPCEVDQAKKAIYRIEYKNGHRDARHSAAELVSNITTKEFWSLAPWQEMEKAPKDMRILLRYDTPIFNGIYVIGGKFNHNKYAKRIKPYWEHDMYRLSGVNDTRAIQPIAWLPLPENK